MCTSGKTLNSSIFSMAIKKNTSTTFLPLFLGTGIREICNFYDFICTPTAPRHKSCHLREELDNWRLGVGRRHMFHCVPFYTSDFCTVSCVTHF